MGVGVDCVWVTHWCQITANLQQKEVVDARGTEGEQEAKWTSSSVAGPTQYPLHMHRRRGAERHVLHILFTEHS